MSCWHKHVAKNHEIAKKLEIRAEIAKLQNGGHRSKMVTNGPHQCFRQPQNKPRGFVQKILKNHLNFFFITGNIS